MPNENNPKIEMTADRGRLRWAVDTKQWDPSPSEFQFLCSLLPSGEAEECSKFRFFDDQKHAVISRLLQRHAAFTALGIPHAAAVIRRTKGRKPYVANDAPRPDAPNFNYSVSHEGDYVILAAEGRCLCGVDVAAPHSLRRNGGQPLSDVLVAFEKQLTPAEWAAVRSGGASLSDAALDSRFRQIWSLKEAYAKATGEGLGFELGRCEFTILPDENGGALRASVAVDGTPRSDWTFFLHPLGREHWVSVARGPLTAIVDAWGGFKATLEQLQVPLGEHTAALEAPEPPFTLLRPCDLVPPSRLAEYEAAGGDIL